jgi:dCTP diphosphatase
MLKLQTDITGYLQERNWDKLALADLSKALSIEAAELLEIFQWGSLDVEFFKENKDQFDSLQSEVSDVFLYCLEIASIAGFDLEEAASTKLQKVNEKYPAEVFKNHLPGSKEYWKVKEEYRKKQQTSNL